MYAAPYVCSSIDAPAIYNGIAPHDSPSEAALGRPVTPTDYVRAFFSARTDIPIYRFALPPGWAYVASMPWRTLP
jgi:hypothetical protein